MMIFSLINKRGSLLLAFILEITIIALTVFSVIPREAILFLTGFLAFYLLFSPIKEAVILFILSIPLFVALPMTENFDTMSNWRILLLLLFIRLIFSHYFNRQSLIEMRHNKFSIFNFKFSINFQFLISKFRKIIFNEKLYLYVFLFFITAFLSLINAESANYGIRKIIFLANAVMIFFVIVNSGMSIKKIQIAGVTSLAISLIIGYAQLAAVFFAPLFNFWQWWANNVIPIFYGQNLANLLSYSNTWFSYYEKSLPTLRIFSIFPDSHSFALFSLIGLIPVTYLWTKGVAHRKLYAAMGIFSLLSVILSGSRGFWASAILIAVILIFLLILKKYWQYIQLKRYFIPLRPKTPWSCHGDGGERGCPEGMKTAATGDEERKIFRYLAVLPQGGFIILLVFFMLFPVGSLILSGSRIGNVVNGGEYEELTLKRIKSIFNFEETSNKGRLEIWNATLNSFVKHPFFGVGIGNFPVVIGESLESSRRGASAHNLYFDIAAEMGIFGLIVFLLIVWEIFKKAYKQYNHNVYAQIFLFYFLWILFYSLFDVVLLNDKVLLLFIVQIATLYLVEKNYKLEYFKVQ